MSYSLGFEPKLFIIHICNVSSHIIDVLFLCTLAVKECGKVRHFKILQKEALFYVQESQTFSDVEALVEYYRSHKLSTLQITEACVRVRAFILHSVKYGCLCECLHMCLCICAGVCLLGLEKPYSVMTMTLWFSLSSLLISAQNTG